MEVMSGAAGRVATVTAGDGDRGRARFPDAAALARNVESWPVAGAVTSAYVTVRAQLLHRLSLLNEKPDFEARKFTPRCADITRTGSLPGLGRGPTAREADLDCTVGEFRSRCVGEGKGVTGRRRHHQRG